MIRRGWRLAAALLCAFDLGVATAVRAAAPSSPMPAAPTAHNTLPSTSGDQALAESAATGVARLLNEAEMRGTVGAGFWSRIWAGVKSAFEIVVVSGVQWLVGEFCSTDQASCTLDAT